GLLGDLPGLLDLAAVQEHVEGLRVLDQDHPFTCERRRSTAARTATPLATWLRITERLLSAASPLISRPRFIGPGCMMMVPFRRVARRSRVRPKKRTYSLVDGKRPACIRSSWRRSIMTTSFSRSARSKSCDTGASRSLGTSVDGPTRVTWFFSFWSAQRFERATRLWAMSPTSATRRPVILPSRWRIVNRSSSAWVGCSLVPSPALTTELSTSRERKAGAPEALWRIAVKATPIDSIVRAVSFRLSPLVRLELAGEKSTTSAPSRRAASANDVFVRVEGSTKKLNSRFPLRGATSFSFVSSSATSRTREMSFGERSFVPRRWRWVHARHRLRSASSAIWGSSVAMTPSQVHSPKARSPRGGRG